jgi:hypothetical protein
MPDDDTLDPLALSAAAEQTIEVLRLLRPDDVRCEAGELTGDTGVHCRIEDSLVDARTSPSSLAAYCCGEPTACPTWRKAREADWGERAPLGDQIAEAAVARRAQAKRNAARQDRMALSAEMLKSPTKEGDAFRERVFRVIREAGRRT